MAIAQVITGDVVIQGALSPKTLNLPANTVTDAGVATPGGAVPPVNAAKLQHAHRAVYAQGSAVNATAATQVVYVVVGTSGAIQSFGAGAVVAAVGGATATVDLKKNGTSVLSAPISLSSSQTARQIVAGAVTTTALAAGDVLEVVITATTGGGTLATGIFCAADIWENPT